MKEERLLNVLGMIDDSFVEELYIHNQSLHVQEKKKIRVYILVAAIILLLAACGVEIVRVLEGNWFTQYFSEEGREEAESQISENQRELLEQGMVAIGQSVTCNGYTVTLDSAISDGYRSFLKFQVLAPDGMSLDRTRYELNGKSQISSIDGAQIEFAIKGVSGDTLPDLTESDNVAEILYKFSTTPDANNAEKIRMGTTWRIDITSLAEYTIRESGSEQYYDPNKTISGEWSFCFSFDENTLLAEEQEILEQPIYCLGKRTLWEHGFPVVIKIVSYKIRAFGATLCFEKPLTGVWEGVELGPVLIFLKDGTAIEGRYRSGLSRKDNWEDTYEFPIPVAVEDISYVQFPGGQKVYSSGSER